GATLASWIGFGAWDWPYAPSGKDGSGPDLLCAAPVGNGTPAKAAVAAAAAAIESLAPTAASAGQQAQSTMGCGGSAGSPPPPIPGGPGPGPVLTVNVGGVLVPIQAVVSQLPHGV